jgi:hypothetical protein
MMTVMMMLLVSILWCASMAAASEVVAFTSEEGGTFPRQAHHKQVAGVLTAVEAVPSSSEGATKRKLVQGQPNLRLTKNENRGDETSSHNLQKSARMKQNEADIEVLTTALATADNEELVATYTAVATANTNIMALIKDLTASNTALIAAKAKIDANNEALDVVNALNAKLIASLKMIFRPEDPGLLKTDVRVNLNLRQ